MLMAGDACSEFGGLLSGILIHKRINSLMTTPTGLPEPLLLEFDGHLLTVSEPAPNQISISFDEMSENLRHEACCYELTKVNSKTVVAALRNQHPQILKAQLFKNPDELFVLVISVNYQFLPQIKEEVILGKREIRPEESEEAAVNNMKNYLRNMKEQVRALTNIQVLTGEIESINNNFEIYVPLPHENTLITWSLTLLKPTNNLHAQVYLFNSATKNKQSTKIIPSEGLYLHYSGEQTNTELRFLLEQSDKYDNALLVLEGNNKGKYIVSIEKVNHE